MSCRHDLALGTCQECYPGSGTIVPDGPGDSMDGPGAAPRTASPLELHEGTLIWYAPDWAPGDRFGGIVVNEPKDGVVPVVITSICYERITGHGRGENAAPFVPRAALRQLTLREPAVANTRTEQEER